VSVGGVDLATLSRRSVAVKVGVDGKRSSRRVKGDHRGVAAHHPDGHILTCRKLQDFGTLEHEFDELSAVGFLSASPAVREGLVPRDGQVEWLAAACPKASQARR